MWILGLLGMVAKRLLVYIRSLLHDRVDPDNKPLITACDFIGLDEYPFWQGATIPQSAEVFWDTMQEVIDATSAVKVGYSCTIYKFVN